MTKRVFNFSAGPAMLRSRSSRPRRRPSSTTKGKGFGIAECSHRGKEFDRRPRRGARARQGPARRADTHDIIFLQGGATQLFATIPMNFLNGPADYVVGGEWSKKAAETGKSVGGDKIRVIATSEATNFDRPATGWTADRSASYLHVCSNETVHGHRLVEWPTHANLVVDSSSEMMSRPHPVAKTASSTRARRRTSARRARCSRSCARISTNASPKNVAKIFSFKADRRGEELPQHAADVRHLHAPRETSAG